MILNKLLIYLTPIDAEEFTLDVRPQNQLYQLINKPTFTTSLVLDISNIGIVDLRERIIHSDLIMIKNLLNSLDIHTIYLGGYDSDIHVPLYKEVLESEGIKTLIATEYLGSRGGKLMNELSIKRFNSL